MAYHSVFIGINKHKDPKVRDLSGAKRDAEALWSLFHDTLPNLKSRFLVDEQATKDAIEEALKDCLEQAQADDVVIVTFSGHGTMSHRLVAHDTSYDLQNDTTIPMSDLATLFRSTQAKAVLCIVDCCFSGGASARVIDGAPIPREIGNPLREIAGEGRILIAAADIDEVAYETPGTGHGLLTKAVLDILLETPGSVNILVASDQIIEKVRVEANRIGVVQTPMVAGSVTGGLVFPQLVKGENYYRFFPDTRLIKIDGSIDSLSVFGFPPTILERWKDAFKTGLNPLQLEAVNSYRVLNGQTLLVVAPTSSGKTFIGELSAVKAVLEGKKAVFLLPYKALTNEKYEQFADLYGERIGMRVIRCTGDYSDQVSLFVRGKYDLALFTYEMFLNVLVSTPEVLNQTELVVLDEAQSITDPTRGISVELLLTYLITARQKGVQPQIIALSAVIGDINHFDEWLGAKTLMTKERPVPLIEGVLGRDGIFQFLDESGVERQEQLLPPGAVRIRRDKASSQDVIVPLVKKLLDENKNERIIVFRNVRGKAEGCAAYLAADLGLPPAINVISKLPTHDLSTTSQDLRRCLQGGTTFHTSNLHRDEKAVVERAFRDPNSQVFVLGATTGLAAGINTPASTVILAEQEFIEEDGKRRPFTVAEYKNMAGRAGRVGFSGEKGTAIILANSLAQREHLFRNYVMGQPEPIRSSFESRELPTWIIRLLAQVDSVSREDVTTLLANTYGGFLENKRHPGWHKEMSFQVDAMLTRLKILKVIQELTGRIQLTLLGRAIGRSNLSYMSAILLVELLQKIELSQLTVENLMAILQMLPEAEATYTPIYATKNKNESERSRDVAQRYGNFIASLLQEGAKDFDAWFKRCKRAAILWDWVQGETVEAIEQHYTPNPYRGAINYGHIQGFANTTRFHLRAAHEILLASITSPVIDGERLSNLLLQLEFGLPLEALDLINLPVPLSRGQYLALFRLGVKSKDDYRQLSEPDRVSVLGEVLDKLLLKRLST